MPDNVRLDTSEIDDAAMNLQEFRRTYYRAVKGGFTQAANLYIVPLIKNNTAPSKYKGKVYASTATWRRDGFRVKFSVKGGQRVKAIVGLQNFGGHLPRPVFPRRRKALRTPDGPRAAVKRGGYIKPKNFFQRGIDAGTPNFAMQAGKIVADRLEKAFNQ